MPTEGTPRGQEHLKIIWKAGTGRDGEETRFLEAKERGIFEKQTVFNSL